MGLVDSQKGGEMRIIESEANGEFILIPVHDDEKLQWAEAIERACFGQVFHYLGRSADSNVNRFTTSLRFNVGGVKEEAGKPPVGGVTVEVKKDSEEDELNHLRVVNFFGTGGLIYLGQAVHEGSTAYRFTGCQCKVCGKNTIKDTCEFTICQACQDKCEHVWTEGFIHGGKLGLGYGPFCEICGLVDKATAERLDVLYDQAHSQLPEVPVSPSA